MNIEDYFEVKYDFPEHGPMSSIGTIHDSSDHIVLVFQRVIGYDSCGYIVIPKKLIKEVIELKVKGVD
jgi:hypothetical protein